jgi:hypothetical protein
MKLPDTLWAKNFGRAVSKAVFNAVVFIILPYIIYGSFFGTLLNTLSIGLETIYAFGIALTILSFLGALTDGTIVSVPFVSGGYLTEVIYAWIVTDGGIMHVSSAGVNLVLSFQPILVLTILAPLFNLVRVPITYFLDGSEVNFNSTLESGP